MKMRWGKTKTKKKKIMDNVMSKKKKKSPGELMENVGNQDLLRTMNVNVH